MSRVRIQAINSIFSLLYGHVHQCSGSQSKSLFCFYNVKLGQTNSLKKCDAVIAVCVGGEGDHSSAKTSDIDEGTLKPRMMWLMYAPKHSDNLKNLKIYV